MTVISEGPLCLKVHLNCQELRYFFESYEKINCENPSVRQTVNRLFELAVHHFEFEQKGHITAELYPTATGGCVFRFCCEPAVWVRPKKVKAKKAAEKLLSYTFVFKNVEDLIFAVQTVKPYWPVKNAKSGLYCLNNRYFLQIFVPESCNKIPLLLQEFCSVSLPGNKVDFLLLEHFNCILKCSAVETLNRYFKPFN